MPSMASAYRHKDDREIDLEATTASDGSDDEDSMDVNSDRQRQLDEKRQAEQAQAEKEAQQKPKRTQKPRAPKPKLTVESLMEDPNGFAYIARTFYDEFSAGYKGKGHEINDLGLLLSLYARWHKRLFPSMKFDEFLLQVEKLSSSNDLRKRMEASRAEGLIRLACVDPTVGPLVADVRGGGGGGEEEEEERDQMADLMQENRDSDDEDYREKPYHETKAKLPSALAAEDEDDPMDELMELHRGGGDEDEDDEELRRREEEEAALEAMEEEQEGGGARSMGGLQRTQVLSAPQQITPKEGEAEEEDDQELMDMLDEEEEEGEGGTRGVMLLQETQVLNGDKEEGERASPAVAAKKRQVLIDSEDED